MVRRREGNSPVAGDYSRFAKVTQAPAELGAVPSGDRKSRSTAIGAEYWISLPRVGTMSGLPPERKPRHDTSRREAGEGACGAVPMGQVLSWMRRRAG